MNITHSPGAARVRNGLAIGVVLALTSLSAHASPVSLFFSGQFFPAVASGPPPTPFDGLSYNLSFLYDTAAADVEPDASEGDYLNLLSNISFDVGGIHFTPISAGPFDSLIIVANNVARPGVPMAGIPAFFVNGLNVVLAFAGAPLGVADFSVGLQSAEFSCAPAVPGFCGPRVGALPGNDLLPQSGVDFLRIFNDPANAAGRVLIVSALDPQLGDVASAAASVDVASVPEPASLWLMVLGLGGWLSTRFRPVATVRV